MKGLKNAKIDMNRKVLAELALNSVDAFNKLVEVAQQSMATPTMPAPKAVKVAKVAKVSKVAKKA